MGSPNGLYPHEATHLGRPRDASAAIHHARQDLRYPVVDMSEVDPRRTELDDDDWLPRRSFIRPHSWRVAHLVGVFVVVVGILFLAVFPTRTYLSQRRDIAASAKRLALLARENRKLEEDVSRLQRDDEIERIARQRFGLVKPGEEAYAVLPAPPAAPDSTARPTPEGAVDSPRRTTAGQSGQSRDPPAVNLRSALADVLQRLF